MTTITPGSPTSWSPDQIAYLGAEDLPELLVNTATTVVGNVEGDDVAVRVPFVSEDPASGFYKEGSAISDDDPTADEVTIFTGKVATVSKFSREQLSQPEVPEIVLHSLKRSVSTYANNAFITNDDLDYPLGLLEQDHHDGGPVDANLDALVDARAHIQTAGGNPNLVLASPSSWAALSKLKTADSSNQALLGAGTEAGALSILGVPVVVSPALPDTALLMLDRGAVLSAVGQVAIARSDDVFFASDIVAVRATLRVGWKVMHSDRIVALTAGDEGSS